LCVSTDIIDSQGIQREIGRSQALVVAGNAIAIEERPLILARLSDSGCQRQDDGGRHSYPSGAPFPEIRVHIAAASMLLFLKTVCKALRRKCVCVGQDVILQRVVNPPPRRLPSGAERTTLPHNGDAEIQSALAAVL
jgi:hypothetical protein